jgi:hypothetical protein
MAKTPSKNIVWTTGKGDPKKLARTLGGKR